MLTPPIESNFLKMEACVSVEKELQKVVNKLQNTAENSSKKLQDGLDDIMMLRTRLLSK